MQTFDTNCFYDGDPCLITLPAVCHHCKRFSAFHAEKLPRLGRVDRSLLIEGLTTNYDKNYLFPKITKSESASRRRSLAKLERCGFVVWDYHVAKRDVSHWEGGYKEVTRRIPRLTPLGHFIATAIKPQIELGKPIRWDSIRPLLNGLGQDMAELKAMAIEYCEKKIETSQGIIGIVCQFGSSSAHEIAHDEAQKIEYYMAKKKSITTSDVTPRQKIDEADTTPIAV